MATQLNAYEYIINDLSTNLSTETIHTISFNGTSKSQKYRRTENFKKKSNFNTEMDHLMRASMHFLDFPSVDYIIYCKTDDLISSAIFIYNVNDKSETYVDVIAGRGNITIGMEMSHSVKNWMSSISGGYGTISPLNIDPGITQLV